MDVGIAAGIESQSKTAFGGSEEIVCEYFDE